jgi:hypothetical protein
MRFTMFRMSACQLISYVYQLLIRLLTIGYRNDRISGFVYFLFLFVLRSIVEQKPEPQEPELFVST